MGIFVRQVDVHGFDNILCHCELNLGKLSPSGAQISAREAAIPSHEKVPDVHLRTAQVAPVEEDDGVRAFGSPARVTIMVTGKKPHDPADTGVIRSCQS